MSKTNTIAGRIRDYRTRYFDPGRQVEGVGCMRVSRDRWPRGFAMERAARDNWLLLVVLSGTGTAWLDGQAYRLAPETVCAVGPGGIEGGGGAMGTKGVLHGFRADAAMEIVALLATGPGCAAHWSDDLGAPACLSAGPSVRDQAETLHALAEAAGAEPDADTTREALHRLHLLLLTIRRVRERARPETPTERTMQRAKVYMDRHAVEIRGMGEVAAACGVSTTHLARLFRQAGEDAPRAYLARRKMAWAADRIGATEASLEGIAQALGYADAFAFSKAFKRAMGRPPSAYRHPLP